MAPTRTRTMKNKHATNKAGIKNSKASSRKPQAEGIVNSTKSRGKAPLTSKGKGRPVLSDLLKKRKKRTYTEKELGIPTLNSIVPVGVQKPKGKKKGKIFVDDPVCSPLTQLDSQRSRVLIM
jgi:60S ribosomal subunit assembly/export protein LOC1